MGNSSTHSQVLIIGGGTAGLMVASQLLRKAPGTKVTILEPSEKHAYQPAWTLVGAGAYDYDKTFRNEGDYIPKGAKWVKEYAETLNPDKNEVITQNGNSYTYDFLVLAPGIEYRLEMIEGLEEAMGKNGVCSNYIDPNYTWELVKNFKGGTALFTQPATPIKCGGAPQKIMYLADDYFRKSGVRDKSKVVFATPGSVIFGVKDFAKTLNQVIARKDIITKYFFKIVKIDGPKKIATFEVTQTDESGCVVIHDDTHNILNITSGTQVEVPYEMLHLAPPQSAPAFIRNSPVAHQDGPSKGWINVDINTLQHNEFANVFALGDAAALPTAKTGAAVRKQAPVVVGNLLQLMQSKPLSNKKYEGYSSCPLVTGYGKMVLAEFKYNNVRDSDPFISKFMDPAKEKWSLWMLKKYGLPYMYWNRMLRGKM